MLAFALVFALPAFAQLPAPGEPGAIDDPRYCGCAAALDAAVAGRGLVRVLREFAKVFPCPATLEPTPSCPGWAIDHVLPPKWGGCDSQINLHWLPDSIKSCADDDCKDRWERVYHAFPRGKVALPEE